MAQSKLKILAATLLASSLLLASCGGGDDDNNHPTQPPKAEKFPKNAWIVAITEYDGSDSPLQSYLAVDVPDHQDPLKVVSKTITKGSELSESGNINMNSIVVPLSVSPDNSYLIPQSRLDPSVNRDDFEPSETFEVSHMVGNEVTDLDLSMVPDKYYDPSVVPYAAAFDPTKPHSLNISFLYPDSDDTISTWQFDLEKASKPPELVKKNTNVSNEAEFTHNASTGLPANNEDLDYSSWADTPYGEMGPNSFLSLPTLSPISYPPDPYLVNLKSGTSWKFRAKTVNEDSETQQILAANLSDEYYMTSPTVEADSPFVVNWARPPLSQY